MFYDLNVLQKQLPLEMRDRIMNFCIHDIMSHPDCCYKRILKENDLIFHSKFKYNIYLPKPYHICGNIWEIVYYNVRIDEFEPRYRQNLYGLVMPPKSLFEFDLSGGPYGIKYENKTNESELIPLLGCGFFNGLICYTQLRIINHVGFKETFSFICLTQPQCNPNIKTMYKLLNINKKCEMTIDRRVEDRNKDLFCSVNNFQMGIVTLDQIGENDEIMDYEQIHHDYFKYMCHLINYQKSLK